MQARRKEEGKKQPWERSADPEIAPLSDRLRNTVRELLRRDPMREDPSYLNPESIPKIGLGEQAIKNLVRASGELFPDTSVNIGTEENPMYFDPTAAFNVGSVGRFNRASKRGNVIHAAPVFGSNWRDNQLNSLSRKNKTTPPTPHVSGRKIEGVPSPRLEIGDFEGVDLSGFSREELDELVRRSIQDEETVYQGLEYTLDRKPFQDLGNAVNEQKERLSEIEALTKKPTARKLYDPNLDNDLGWRHRGYDAERLAGRLQDENRALPGGPDYKPPKKKPRNPKR